MKDNSRKYSTSCSADGLKGAPGSSPLLATLQCVGACASEVAELFDYVEDVLLWIKDVDGHYQWVNLSFLLNFAAQRREEVIGRTDFDLCSPALANQYRMDDERVLQGERILSRVELVGRFDHTARWCVTSKVPLRNPKGKVVGTAGVTHPLQGRPLAAGDAPMSPAVRFISEHYAESITNKHLAGLCGLSVRAFERQFLAMYRASPHEYLRQLRVRMSCSGLVFSRKTLAELASEFGFADQSHFTKEFRRFLGETPSAYRTRYARR
jgi:AraC-like DNA-binding protein